jgi:hypothetical protein
MRGVPIRRFIWTRHAELRIAERDLARWDVERVVLEGHSARQINRGGRRLAGRGNRRRRLSVCRDLRLARTGSLGGTGGQCLAAAVGFDSVAGVS